MHSKTIKKIYTWGSVTFLSLLITSCESFLTKESMDKLIPSSFFKTESDLSLYTNSFYQKMIPSALTVTTADEMGDYTSKNQSPM